MYSDLLYGLQRRDFCKHMLVFLEKKPWVGLKRGKALQCYHSCPRNRGIHLLLFSRSVMSNSLQPHRLQHAGHPCPSPFPRVYSNSCPLSQWCHPTISSSVIPFSSCLSLSQHQDTFKWVSSSHQVAKVLEFQLQHQSFQWIFRTDCSRCCPRDSQESSPITQFKSINSSALNFLSTTLTSIHDYWKNRSFD